MPPLDEAKQILSALGMPVRQQNDISGYTLLALTGLRASQPWSEATAQRCNPSGIIGFLSAQYGRSYRENTRETIRRQVLHQMEQGGVIVRNPDQPDLPTNSPNTRYAFTDEALTVVRSYGTEDFDKEAARFLTAQKGGLALRYARPRTRLGVEVRLPDGQRVSLSPGKHNDLQRAIVEDFLAHFVPGARLLYLGDTDAKSLVVEGEALLSLGVPVITHGKLPDVVAYDPQREWLFLCEAVASHGPVSPKRFTELEDFLQEVSVRRVYVSAFQDFREYRRHVGEIAWETEVWIAEQPTHLLHYDGEHFISPTS